MTTALAIVGPVNDRGHLTPASTITVAGEVFPIPDQCPRHGLALYWHRVLEAIEPAGWEQTEDPPMALEGGTQAAFVVRAKN
jgi:hypothetical protein